VDLSVLHHSENFTQLKIFSCLIEITFKENDTNDDFNVLIL
jgi:hypothetical protein